jgi:hypothetical protein
MPPLVDLRPLRKGSFAAKLDTRLRMNIEMEDWEVEEIVEGECLRLGVSSIGEGGPGNVVDKKEGMGANEG